jgi:hypothetical protein
MHPAQFHTHKTNNLNQSQLLSFFDVRTVSEADDTDQLQTAFGVFRIFNDQRTSLLVLDPTNSEL